MITTIDRAKPEPLPPLPCEKPRGRAIRAKTTEAAGIENFLWISTLASRYLAGVSPGCSRIRCSSGTVIERRDFSARRVSASGDAGPST